MLQCQQYYTDEQPTAIHFFFSSLASSLHNIHSHWHSLHTRITTANCVPNNILHPCVLIWTKRLCLDPWSCLSPVGAMQISQPCLCFQAHTELTLRHFPIFFKSTSSRFSVSQTAYLPMNRGSAWLWLQGLDFLFQNRDNLELQSRCVRLANTCHPSEAYDECNA